MGDAFNSSCCILEWGCRLFDGGFDLLRSHACHEATKHIHNHDPARWFAQRSDACQLDQRKNFCRDLTSCRGLPEFPQQRGVPG